MQKYLLTLLLCFPLLLFGQENTFTAPANGDLLIEACEGTLYDSGGPDGNYSDDNFSTVIIQSEGDYLELTFTEFAVENAFDFLYISSNDELIGAYTGNELPNNGQPIFIPTNEVTIFFQSDFTITESGFALNFVCAESTAPPVAAAGFPGFICSGQVSFLDNSTFFPETWEWDFGDGNTSTEQNPTHTYAEGGVYSISLTVCNENGCDTFTAVDAITYDSEDFICSNGVNMPEFGQEETSLCTGILFDSGGPEGNYGEGIHSQFLIAPPSATSMNITFTEFELETSYGDFVYIYDGETSDLLDIFNGNTLPNGGATITYNVSSINVVFISDHYENFAGFAMLWQANGTFEAPIAAFSTPSLNVPLNTPITFTDNSENEPGLWEWTFGDSGTSDEQNPSYVFTTPGTYEVNLTVGNCNGSDTAESITITVQEAPAITVNPDSYNINLEAGTTSTELLNICNNGTGALALDINVQANLSGSGYAFDFILNENGENFIWSILTEDFVVIEEGTGGFSANETVSITVDGLDENQTYLLLLGSNNGAPTIEELIWYDTSSGEVLFQGQLESGPEAFYLLPPPTGGIATISWLGVANEPNLIDAGNCSDYEVIFDANDLIAGVYEGAIIINSNDPNSPSISIPVTLTVTGEPEISISQQTLDFGEVQIGANSALTFTVENTGADILEVSGLEFSQSVFGTSTLNEFSIAPNQSQDITVNFVPTAVTSYTETITLVNSAGDDVIVNVLGSGISSPSFNIDPTQFTVELIQGQDTTLNVNIGNTGEADLTYSAVASSDASGFRLEFTTVELGGFFYWTINDSQGNEVANNYGGFYPASSTIIIDVTNVSPDESYTLSFFDEFGSVFLPEYTFIDIASGNVVAQGDFAGTNNDDELIIELGSPTEEVISVSPANDTVAIDNSQVMSLFIDSQGLAAGTYNLVVDVTTNDPLQPTAAVNVTLFVIAPVVTDFSASPTFVCGNVPVQFTDESDNIATSWLWDFGDGSTSTEQNPSYQYTADGFYSVSLVACNSLGCDTLVRTNEIEVQLDCYSQNIPTGHTTEFVTVCEGTVYDSGGPDADYLEGNFGILTIAPPGAEQVTITFTEFNYQEHADFVYLYDNNNLIGTYTGTQLQGQTIVAESGILKIQEYTDHYTQLSGFVATFTCETLPSTPVAFFNYIGDSICVNEPFLFFDQSSGTPDSWFWDFGNGFTSNEQNPVINFTATDTVNVSLTACNDFGCDTYIIENVEIILDKECFLDSIPVGLGENTIINSCAGSLYDSGGADGDYFQNQGSTVTIVRPEGTIAVSFSAFEYFGEDGVYVFDGPDFNSPLIGFYTGNELPENGGIISSTGPAITIAEFTFSGTSLSGFALDYTCSDGTNVGPGNLRVFNDEICDGILRFGTPEEVEVDTWQWEFGDGSTSTEATPTHEYAEHGAYDVELTTCYQGECETQMTTVYSNKLVPDIDAPFAAALGEEVHFHGQTEQATHWFWDFGNGETASHSTPSTVYEELGVHEVNIILGNINVHTTCNAQHTHTVTVTEDGTTNLAEEVKQTLRAYPNPANDFITIESGQNTVLAEGRVILRTVDGRIVRDQELLPRIEVSTLPNGTYFMQVQVEEEVPQQFKIVIQH